MAEGRAEQYPTVWSRLYTALAIADREIRELQAAGDTHGLAAAFGQIREELLGTAALLGMSIEDEPETCDECGEEAPEDEDGVQPGSWHAPSCSLHMGMEDDG